MPRVALADLGDVEAFGRHGEEDQLYAFQLTDGVYKRKEDIISSDGSTSMQANDLGCNRIVNLADPAEPQAATGGYVDSRILDSQIFVRQVSGMIWESKVSFGLLVHEKPLWIETFKRHKKKEN